MRKVNPGNSNMLAVARVLGYTLSSTTAWLQDREPTVDPIQPVPQRQKGCALENEAVELEKQLRGDHGDHEGWGTVKQKLPDRFEAHPRDHGSSFPVKFTPWSHAGMDPPTGGHP
jgi:hypothetical protein